MTSRDKSTERQFSLDSAFSSLSSELCHKMMTSSYPSYDFKTAEIFTTSPKIDPTTFIYNPGPVKSSSRRPVIQHHNIPLLNHLEPHNTGFLSPLCLVHYWEGLGVPDGSQVLEDLGLSADEERLDLRIVSQKLNDEIGQALEIVSYASVQAAIATLYDEVVIVKNTLDNANKERDKFRADIQEAQKRAEVLALEMDEQNYQHDKLKQDEIQDLRQTWVERLQSVEEKLNSERETHETEIQGLKRTFYEEKTNIENIQRKMEKELSTKIEENMKLEDELESKIAMMAELEEINSCLRKKKEKPGHKIENVQEHLGPDSTQDMIHNVEELVRVNKDLKDRNEELEINILVNSYTDGLPNSLHENKMKRKGCLLPESPPPSSKSKMTKKNTEILLETAPSEPRNCTDVSESENDEITSLFDIWCSFDQPYKMPSPNIYKPCKTLEDELDHINLDILEEKIEQFKGLKVDEETDTNRLFENNKHLEESLELMQTEFESMEDYWQKKMDEERIFYEEQLQVSENQFKELEARMKEYEELLTNMESSKHDHSDRLYAIDEQRSLEESVNEWEEEISQLKLQIEEIEMNHEEEVLALKEEIILLTQNSFHQRNLDTFNKTSCTRCCDFSSLKKKRKNLELSWKRVVKLSSDENRPLLLPESNCTSNLISSARLGPSSSSLPSYPALDVEQEANRRQELRQYIREDYDQMLLRKERQKICDTGLSKNEEQNTCIASSHSSIVSEQRKNEECGSMCYVTHCDAGTQAPQVAALKAILYDISSQVSLLESELSKLGHSDKILQDTLHVRLSTQASRSHQLQSSLASKRARYTEDMADMKEHQISEISHLEYLVTASQDLLRKQTKTFMERMDKLVMMDTTMEQSMTDNQVLTEHINLIKKKGQQ